MKVDGSSVLSRPRCGVVLLVVDVDPSHWLIRNNHLSSCISIQSSFSLILNIERDWSGFWLPENLVLKYPRAHHMTL